MALRLGCFTNKDKPKSYTAGLGLELWIINTNIAVVKNDDGDNVAIVTGEIRF
jgi:hypothetical protein